MNTDRYARQRRLAEVGDAGQQRLATLTVSLPASETSELECEYLRRAGVGQVTIADGTAVPFVHGDHFRVVATRRVAAGAWRALMRIRARLGLLDA